MTFFRSCKNFFQCYECAKMENPICKGDQVKYKYRLVQDRNTDKKSIECGKLTKQSCLSRCCLHAPRLNVLVISWIGKELFLVNREGTCARNICECDKRWSETLANFEDEFNPWYHKNRGVPVGSTWKYNQQCKRSKGLFGKPEECCGESYPDKMPLQKVHRSP